ncbi:hypothetical protein [Parapedobacter sp.]
MKSLFAKLNLFAIGALLVAGASAFKHAEESRELTTFYMVNGQWHEGPLENYECKPIGEVCSAEFEAGSNPAPDAEGENQTEGSYLPI